MEIQNILNSTFHNKSIKLNCVVIGKSLQPYTIPKKIKLNCIEDIKSPCGTCKYHGNGIIDVVPNNEDILKFIDISSAKIPRVIQEILRKKCKFSYEILEMQNIERIFIMPPTGKDRTKIKLSTISYFIGSDLDINTTYELTGYTTVYPKDQTTTHVFSKAKRLKTTTETFKLTKNTFNDLNVFAIENPSTDKIYSFLTKLYREYAHHVTKIYNRFDLHLAVDLVFKSALSFKFDNEFVFKGWIDVMIIGDARCGKGFVGEKLVDYFGVGEVVGADNATYAGLVGGLDKLDNNWTVRWGKIPLNDGGLLMVDEASELGADDWTKLSRLRSEGLAEITKIHTQITNARTRMLFVANPPNKAISNYSYGIQSLQDVVKAPEDIARFDYALVVANNEVAIDDINKHRDVLKNTLSPKLEQDLILWIWSRKSDEIEFSPNAIKSTYELAIKLAKTYTHTIPLIQGENIRIKLAKIAVAFAGRTFSNKQKGKILFVDSVHIECAYIFLNLIYKKDVSGYYAFSKLQSDVYGSSNDDNAKAIEKHMAAFAIKGQKETIYKYLLSNNNITVNALTEHINSPDIARELIAMLLRNSYLTQKIAYYVKTPQFTKWLKNKLLGGW